MRQLVRVTEVFVFVSLLTHWLSMARGFSHWTRAISVSSRLSVCIFSPCSLSLSSHWTFTIHANSGAGAEHSPLIDQRRPIPGPHWPGETRPCWQKRITRCSIISLEEWFIHSSTDTARSLLYTCYLSHPGSHPQSRWNVTSTFTF